MFENTLPLPAFGLPQPPYMDQPSVDPVLVIRSQAQEIIDETLHSPWAGPEARELLRQRLVQTPSPVCAEQVLLAHLRAMVSLNNPGFGLPEGQA